MKHIAESAKIGQNTKIGFNSIIEKNVKIGDNCLVGHNVVIHSGSKIGDTVRIDDNTIIGKKPLFSPRSIFKKDKFSSPSVGDECLIGANVIIYVGCEIGEKNLIADLSTVRENVEIGDLNIIGRNVSVENYVKIGNRNKIETNAYITAYSEIDDYCFIAPSVVTSNDNYMGRDKERYKHFKGIKIKRGGRIGVNATILPGITIEEDGMVAGASVVSKDVPKEKIVLGSPAKEISQVDEKQLLKNNLDSDKN